MKYTKEQLLNLHPCHSGLAFAESCNFDCSKIYETCERGDWLIWLLLKTNVITKLQAVNLACECAEHVLSIYEKKCPSDKRPRQAIEAAREWSKNPTEENQAKCRTAADAAYAYDAAAYAAYAAAAAAYAAYAAAAAYAYVAAAAAAADADADAAYAAYAAAAAAAAAAGAECKWQADKIREIIPNPFQ